jgi:hypothetical protein
VRSLGKQPSPESSEGLHFNAPQPGRQPGLPEQVVESQNCATQRGRFTRGNFDILGPHTPSRSYPCGSSMLPASSSTYLPDRHAYLLDGIFWNVAKPLNFTRYCQRTRSYPPLKSPSSLGFVRSHRLPAPCRNSFLVAVNPSSPIIRIELQ